MTREEKSQVIQDLTAVLADTKHVIFSRYFWIRCRNNL